MSVINHVLQQLDKRQAGSTLSALQAAAKSGGVPLAPVPENQSRRLMLIVSLGAGLIAAAAFAPLSPIASALPQSPPALAQTASPAGSETATGARAEAATDSASAAPVFAQRASAPTTGATLAHRADGSSAAVAGPLLAAPSTAPAPAALVVAAATGPALPTLAPPLPQITKQILPTTPKERARHLLAQALEAAQSGHSHLASERALQALTFDSQLSPARELAAQLALETGRSADAESLLSEGLDESSSAHYVVLLARLRAERGDEAGALQLLNSRKIYTAEAEGLRAALLAQGGEHAQALPSYEAALRQQPGNATWWLGLGVSLEAQGQPQRARNAYERAQQLGLPSADLSGWAGSRLRALP